MSQPKGSVGVALAIAIIIIVGVTSVGYYQFVSCTPTSCATSTSTSSTAGPACAPPSCITIQIVVGAATLTTTAYSPDSVKLVVGVNNTFEFHNNDSESGGVFHSATANTCPNSCPFDTGIIGFNTTMGPYTITTPGTYPFHCEVHPTTMAGTITVVAGSGGSTGAASTTTTSSSSGSQSAAAPANGFAISIPKGSSTNQAAPGFTPSNATLVVGVNNTVTWTNNDIAGHTVTFTSTPPGATVSNSDLLGPGDTFTQTFTVAGTYQYHCTINAWMKGTIIVKSA